MSLPRDKLVKINDLILHYLDWGNSNATPIVLLHGLYSHAHYWDFFARSLTSEYRVLALDQRGHGDSGWTKSYGPKEYVLDLEAFVKNLGLDKFILIGHSMGGINTIIYAAQHPDLISALVIVDIGPEINNLGIERMEKERSSEPEFFGSEEEAISYMKKIEPRHSDEFVRHQVRYALRRDDNGNLTFKYDPALRSTELRSPDWLWEYVGQVVCPTLLVHGTESDMLAAEVAKKMGESLAFGSIVDVEHAGHSVLGDNPQSFEAAVSEFLKMIELHSS
jgi:pimeloyl-ACP methyl ester carboxylesterase